MGLTGLWDRFHCTEFHAPSFHALHSGITGEGRPREEGYLIKVMNGITPIDAHSSHYFYAFSRNFGVDDQGATDALVEAARQAAGGQQPARLGSAGLAVRQRAGGGAARGNRQRPPAGVAGCRNHRRRRRELRCQPSRGGETEGGAGPKKHPRAARGLAGLAGGQEDLRHRAAVGRPLADPREIAQDVRTAREIVGHEIAHGGERKTHHDVGGGEHAVDQVAPVRNQIGRASCRERVSSPV